MPPGKTDGEKEYTQKHTDPRDAFCGQVFEPVAGRVDAFALRVLSERHKQYAEDHEYRHCSKQDGRNRYDQCKDYSE